MLVGISVFLSYKFINAIYLVKYCMSFFTFIFSEAMCTFTVVLILSICLQRCSVYEKRDLAEEKSVLILSM